MNFNSVYATASELYGIDEDIENLEELALIGWSKIGNYKSKLHHVVAFINPEDNTVTLPCDSVFDEIEKDIRIEYVTYGFEDYQRSTNLKYNNIEAEIVEEWIEGSKEFKDPFYSSGKFAKFEIVGRTLYFEKDYGKVHIAYKKLITDSEGLPDLTEREVQAIATYLAYVLKQKEAWKTNNGNLLQMAQYMNQKWMRERTAATIPEYFSQNDMNRILDAYSRWDRKRYGQSYKPIL